MEEKITLLHAKCVTTIIEMLEKHPYFILEKLSLPMEGVSVPVLSCYDDPLVFRNVCFIATFRPKNGENKGMRFGVIMTRPQDKEFVIAVGQMDVGYEFSHLTRSVKLRDCDHSVHAISILFTTLCKDIACVFRHGWRNHHIPREWVKSYHKAIFRFIPDIKDRVWRDAAFYPGGTMVMLRELHSSGLAGEVNVTACVGNGPGRYLLQTDRYAEKEYDYIDRRPDVSTGFVSRIVKRGSGKTATPDAASYLYHRAFADVPDAVVSFHECQKEARRGVFKNIVATKRTWTGPVYDFVLSYLLAFRPGVLTFSNTYQFKEHAFMDAVCERGWDYSEIKINKKRFRKQLKRIHCYFEKLSTVIKEDKIEEEQDLKDLDIY